MFTRQSGLRALMLVPENVAIANKVLKRWETRFNVAEAPKVDKEIYIALTNLLRPEYIEKLFNFVGKDNLNMSGIYSREQKAEPVFNRIAALAKQFYNLQIGKSVSEST